MLNSKKVEAIANHAAPISGRDSVNSVFDLFQRNEKLNFIPVIEEGIAIGLIVRERFFSKLFSSRYGMELHGKKPIKAFIKDTPISFDKNLTIQQVSKQLTTALRSDQAFLITDNGAYFGIATILSLLEEITQQQILTAKQANPLTLLPGSVYINECINQMLSEQQPFCVGYFDLDNFKPYNDMYGYSAGDSIIKAVADTLTRHISDESGYVGHIGGDDFIVIFTTKDWLIECQNILADFEKRVPGYYQAEHVRAGGFYSEDRHGQKHFFCLLSLSVGLVNEAATSHCQSHVDIADLASEAKKQAKKLTGNSYFINRRILKNGHPPAQQTHQTPNL